MAEDLGQAQLTLTVNLDKFREDLRNAKRLVASELGDAGVGGTRSRRSSTTQAGSGTRTKEQRERERQNRAEERARDKRAREERAELARRARQGGARENTRALEIAQEKRFRLARRIDDLEERGASVSRLRNQLGQLTEAQSKRQFGTFRKIGQELARQVTLEDRRADAQNRQERASQKQARLGARNGGASESITALQDAQDRRFRLSQRINRLEERGVRVEKLRSQLGDLTTSYAQRQFGTAKQLSRELGRQVTLTEARARRERDAQQAVERRTKAEQAATARSARIGGPRSPIQGSRSIPDSPAFLDAQRKRQASDLTRAARIGGPREPIQGRKNIEGSPAFIREQVKRSTDIYKKFVEQQARELTRAARAGGPAEPIRGRVDLQGSPAAIQADQKARAAAAREEQRRRREEAARIRAQRAEELRIARGNASPISGLLPGGVRIPGSPAAKGRDFEVRNSWKVFLDQLVETKEVIEQESAKASARLKGPALPVSGRLINGQVVPGSPADLQQRAGSGGAKPRGPASPITGRLPGGGSLPGSPAALADAERKLAQARRKVEADTRRLSKDETKRSNEVRKKVGGAVGSGLIGGGFPLLFGQGAGAAAGGALGGIGGGALGGQFGFALSIVGTAIGQAFDTALQKGQDLAKGLDDPIGNFQLLADAALFSSKAVEKNVASLIAAGREEEAAIAARRDLSQRFGGAENAKALTQATDELNRAWTEATVSLTAFVAGPLADFLKSIATGLGGSPDQGRAVQDNARAMELVNSDPQLRKQFVDLAKQRGVSLDSNLEADDLGKRVELVKEFLQLQGELTGAQREQQQLDAASADAAKRRKDIEALTLGIIRDQARGNRTGELEKARRLLPLQQTKELNILPANATEVDREAVRTKFARELLKIDGERLTLQRELNLTIGEESAKREQIAQDLRAVRARRDAALAAGDFAANPGNSVLAARAGELEGASFLAQNRLRLEQAITSERKLQYQLSQETDGTKRSQLAEQLSTAAEEIRLAGEEAGAALAEKAASAAQSLRGAQDALRGTLQSNFKFLPNAQRQSLLASARADIDRGRAAGILRPNFGATGRRRTFEAADFVRNVEQQRAQVAQQQALVEALKENTAAERNIRINVTMNADGTFNINQTEQQAALL